MSNGEDGARYGQREAEGANVAVEGDLTDPLVEGGILEHGVEFLLRDHTILARYVVHVDEQMVFLRPASE